MSAERPRIAAALLLSAGVVAADQIAKAWISARLSPGESIPLIEGLFQIRRIANQGGLFGILRDLPEVWRTVVFSGVPLVASAGLLLFLARAPASERALRAGLALILGGALGNLIDRLRLGHVVDFLDVYWRTHHWPAFNLADSAICVGVGLILLDAFRGRSRRPSPAPGAGA
jgi:signal peptidase II